MTSPPDESAPPRPHAPDDLHVVALGASAGGIAVLQRFFGSAPPDSRIAYVVILHLSPDHDSKLAEVLQTATQMPVTRVVERTPMTADHVYVVPPNKSLEDVGGTLVVSEITRVEQRRSPVDVFFRTLADAHGSRAAAVILSGTGPNGSAGIKRVKEQGGLVVVQNPADAQYADMPRNAIATGLVDFVLPVEAMPAKIGEYFARLDLPAASADAPTVQRDAMREVLAVLRSRTGHDFSNYKQATLLRRISRRMNVGGVDTMSGYAQFIREQPDEAGSLMRELLISVTNFFRDPEAFAVLKERIVPRLFHHKHGADQLRVWVPGCATGEEAYSIAMLLVEHTDGLLEPPAIQVFATDLDERAVAVAREGLYSEAEIADVPEDRLRRFFQREPGGYRVRRDFRELLLFAHHNVIKDPPFSHLDLVSCRNVLIYLNRSIQAQVTETFHFALRPGGYLFLGTSEQPEGDDLFVTVDKNAHIYESRSPSIRAPLPRVDRALLATPRLPKLEELAERLVERASPAEVHVRLLEQYAPPSVVVTEDHAVVHVSEKAARYLRVSAGEPTRDILRLVAAELRADLRRALHQAVRQRSSVQIRALPDSTGTAGTHVTLTVRPMLQEGDPARGYFVILFEEADALPPDAPVPLDLPSAASPDLQLEEEVGRIRTELRTTVEQYETQVEEVKASNEELQAMNEELWSATEELETSKEELQSVNEELTTVNQELKVKIEELAHSNNDFQNLINSTDIGTIFLDRSMRVKMTTPRAADVFNLLPSDIGRPLSHITSRLLNDPLPEDIPEVLRRLTTVEREVETRDGRWFFMRVLPYRTSDDRIDGVVVTFQDVTSRHAAEQQVRSSADLQQRITDHQVAEREISDLLRKLVANQEDQRARIARDLHDQLGQQLTTLRLVLERHRNECRARTETIDEALAITRKIDGDVDFLTWELRPTLLEDLGLSIAIARYVEEWSKRFGITAKCRCGALGPDDLSRDVEVVFYRLAQEALNNVAKHAHSTRVDIVLERRDGDVRLVVEDDGVGFDTQTRDTTQGFGLIGMRERATLVGATLQVESRPGYGTSIYVTAPAGAKPPS